jgi:hypothetical protein
LQLKYPVNVIWYIEAGSPYRPAQNCGSAVAIRLQRIGHPETGKTYLLTCAHVIRGPDQNNEAGYGPLWSKINAWPPGAGAGKDQARETTIAATIKNLEPGEVPTKQRANAADDWVILEIEDAQAASAADPVEQWCTAADSSVCRIYSYPGGRKAFQEGMVKPTPSHDEFPHRAESMGVLYLHGDASRAGSSGGGVFLESGNGFVGIHRARDHDTLQVHAVSARKICDYLDASGYVPVERGQRSTPLQEKVSELRHKLWMAKDHELERIRFEVEALRAKEENKWDLELHQLELDVQRALKSLQWPAILRRYGRRQWVKLAVAAASLLFMASATLWITETWIGGPPSATFEQINVAELIEGESTLNNVIDDMLVRKTSGTLDLVLTAETNRLRRLPAGSRYVLRSNLEGTQLEVAGAVIRAANQTEAVWILAAPPGLTGQSIELLATNTNTLSDVRIRLVIGVKFPPGSPLEALPDREQEDTVRESLTIEKAP